KAHCRNGINGTSANAISTGRLASRCLRKCYLYSIRIYFRLPLMLLYLRLNCTDLLLFEAANLDLAFRKGLFSLRL
ncbi:MAG: hypothetical protein AAF394_10310, partial [Planctomycetota bacterium]